jgi:uncharacterized damage-inducible protein DinB
MATTHSAERKPPSRQASQNDDRAEVRRIQDQLERAFYKEAWHGPALMELLRETPVDVAPAKPLEHAHSIWEIVLHITAWHNEIARRLGGQMKELSVHEDWPPLGDVDESDWNEAVRQLEDSYHTLQSALGKLSDADLQKPAPGRAFSTYVNAHGIIQHTIYHTGQIALLKKSSR